MTVGCACEPPLLTNETGAKLTPRMLKPIQYNGMRQRKLIHLKRQFLKARADQQWQSYCMSHADWRSMLSMPWQQAWDEPSKRDPSHCTLHTCCRPVCPLFGTAEMLQVPAGTQHGVDLRLPHGVICTCMPPIICAHPCLVSWLGGGGRASGSMGSGCLMPCTAGVVSS